MDNVRGADYQVPRFAQQLGATAVGAKVNDGFGDQAQDTKLPSILVVSVVKSGTVFIGRMLSEGLRMRWQPGSIAVGSFPRYSIDLRKVEQFAIGGLVVSEHLDASAENLQFLDYFVDRWVVNIRDPRSVLVSWVHHLNRLDKGDDFTRKELLRVCPTPPDRYFRYSFSEQVEWNIEHFLPNVIMWTRQWVEASDSRRHRVLLTSYVELLQNEKDLMSRILAFYGIAPDKFEPISLERTMATHFRVGRSDEWRDAFTPDQIARATGLIGDDLLRRFDWPLAQSSRLLLAGAPRCRRRMRTTEG